MYRRTEQTCTKKKEAKLRNDMSGQKEKKKEKKKKEKKKRKSALNAEQIERYC